MNTLPSIYDRSNCRTIATAFVKVAIFFGAAQLSEFATAQNKSVGAHTNYEVKEKEVEFLSEEGTITIAGTLALPQKSGPLPALILIPGASPFDRDETFNNYKPFAQLAESLSRRGIAVLRTDDRGVGGSTGSKLKSRMTDLAGDVAAGIEFLKARKDIDAGRIGLVGHSFGGALAIQTAVDRKDVAFVVLLAGPGGPGAQTIFRSISRSGVGLSEFTDQCAESFLQALDDHTDAQKALRVARSKWAALVKQLPEKDRRAANSAIELGGSMIQKFISSRLLLESLRYDSAQFLQQLRCPVLALAGSSDPVHGEIQFIVRALVNGGVDDWSASVTPGVTHLLQKDDAKSNSEQANDSIDQIAPQITEILESWLRRRAFTDK